MKRITCILIATMLILQLFAVVASAEIPENINLITNGDFEGGVEPWYNPSNVEMTIIEGGGMNGSDCIEVDNGYATRLSQKIAGGFGLTAGDTYYISAYMKLPEGCSTTDARIKVNNTVDRLGSTAYSTSNISVSDQWTKISMIYTVPTAISSDTGPDKNRIQIYASNGGGYTGKYYVDNVEVISKSAIRVDGIQIDGVEISDFDPATMEYTYKIPYGSTTVPTVTATVGSYVTELGLTTYVVEPAQAPTGSTKVIATAPDGKTTKTYTIKFEEMEPLTLKPVTISGDLTAGSTLTAVLPIKNNSVSGILGADLTLVIALYGENGELIDLNIAPATAFAISSLQEQNLTVDLTIGATTDVSKCKLGAFVINNFVSGMPTSKMIWR